MLSSAEVSAVLNISSDIMISVFKDRDDVGHLEECVCCSGGSEGVAVDGGRRSK